MEYLISILTCIGTVIVLYFAYIRPLNRKLNMANKTVHDLMEESDEFFEDYQCYKFLYEVQNDELKELKKENKKLRSKGMYKVTKKRGRPRKENK